MRIKKWVKNRRRDRESNLCKGKGAAESIK
jgi:hypothetical protein